MMYLVVTTIFLQILTSVFSQDITANVETNKTKRTVASQIQNFDEARPFVLYTDNSGSSTSGLTNFYPPVKPVFDSEAPKQVAAQQVLYEFQQTPTNGVSNVHLNQYYQPIPQNKQENLHGHYYYNQDGSNPSQFVSGGANVATPVQHSSLIRHGQNYAQLQLQQPLAVTPHHIQPQQYIPGKYVYVNGKVLFQPNYLHKPISYVTYPQQKQTQPITRPINYNRQFQPPQPHQIQKITEPMITSKVTEEQNEEAKEEQNEEDDDSKMKNHEDIEENDESGEKAASYEEEDDDESENRFEKYSFSDNDDEEQDSYKMETEEEDDDDNERDSSKNVPKKQKTKYNKSNNYKYGESYSSSTKYEKPQKQMKKNSGKSPKMHYKSVKYSMETNGKPRNEKFEGKQSRNVPIIHKEKIFKEKWYVTKSTDDSL